MSVMKVRTAPGGEWVEVPLGGGGSGASAADQIAYDDTNTALGAGNSNAPIDTVQKAIEALAEDDISSEVVQEMIDENLSDPAFFPSIYDLLDISGTIVFGSHLYCATPAEMKEKLAKYHIAIATAAIRIPNMVGSYGNSGWNYAYATDTLTEGGVGGSVYNQDVVIHLGGNKIIKATGFYNGSSTEVKNTRWAALANQLKKILYPYNNSVSGLTATTLGGAIDELTTKINNLVDANEVSY